MSSSTVGQTHNDIQGAYHTAMTARNEILSNLAIAESHLRLTMKWLEAMRSTVAQMNLHIQSLETQLSPAVNMQGSGAVYMG